jgi:membrane associated rhomboid family serine protease/ribosomal protein L40E
MAFLQIKRSDGQVKVFKLRVDRVVIGRADDADVVIEDARVSRRHAVLQRSADGRWQLQDLGSRNKTCIGEQPISTCVLQNGEIFSIGGVPVRFVENRTPVSVPPQSHRTRSPGNSTAATRSPVCPECKARVDASAVLCVKCGYNFKTGKRLASTAPLPIGKKSSPSRSALPELPTSSPGLSKICPCCEQTLPPGSMVCTKCGIDVDTGRSFQTALDSNLNDLYMYAESTISVISWIFWTGLYPIASEAFGLRKPWVIRGIAITTILISCWFMIAYLYNSNPNPSLGNLMHWCGDATLVRNKSLPSGEYHPYQLITCAFLHGGPIHLAGNMLFLMVFGSRINALIGNFLTLLLYPILAMAASTAHMIATAAEPLTPALGASGAVMGLAGMYLVLMPTPKVHMAAWARWGLVFGLIGVFFCGFRLSLKLFAVRGFWVVLFYIAFDVLYTVLGLKDNVGHWAHLGGFLSGMAIGLILLFARLINARGGDLVSVILGKRAWALVGKPNRETPELW